MDKQPLPEGTSNPIKSWLEESEEFARRAPSKAVITAFVVGLLFNLLPIRAMVRTLIMLLFTSTRPVMLFLGFMKALDMCRKQTNPTSAPL
jgi:hypothetical protein